MLLLPSARCVRFSCSTLARKRSYYSQDVFVLLSRMLRTWYQRGIQVDYMFLFFVLFCFASKIANRPVSEGEEVKAGVS